MTQSEILKTWREMLESQARVVPDLTKISKLKADILIYLKSRSKVKLAEISEIPTIC